MTPTRESTPGRWTTEDGKLAAEMWPELPANCVKMLEFVIEHGTTDAMPVVEALGLKDPTQIVGVHGRIGRICAQFDRKSPIKARPTEYGTVWSIDPAIGVMFKQAKKPESQGAGAVSPPLPLTTRGLPLTSASRNPW